MIQVFLMALAVVAGPVDPTWNIHVHGPNKIEIDVSFPDGVDAESSVASARLVPAPGGVLPRVELAGVDSELCQQADESRWDSGPVVTLGSPAVAAGLEVTPLVVRRGRTDESGRAVRYRRVSLVLHYALSLIAGSGRGEMARLLGADFDLAESDGPTQPVGYLVVVPDDFYDNVLPFARWKERKGFTVWVKKTSETGTTKEQIQQYIRDAYSGWSPAPSYVLLAGAVNKIPAFITSGTPCVTDHPYACADGSDYLADLFVGRLPAANTSELDVMVAKVLGYEMSPFMADTGWYRRALMVGTSYQEGGTPAVTALVTKRWVRGYLFDHGFSSIDTVFYPPTRYGRGPIDSAVNRGVLFINGRGWGNYDGWGYPQFLINDVYALNNGWMLPVVTSIYCGTGNYQRNPCFGEAWLRAGTPTTPKGSVAFWGSSYTGTSTRWNNSMDYGIYRAMFDRGLRTCAPAMYAGKMTQFQNFPMPEDSFDLRLYFHVYNLMGDPAMEMWTGVPQPINVTYPGTIPVGTSSFSVVVQNASGQGVADASVCLSKPGEVHKVALTDRTGRVTFAVAASTEDSMMVTVTGANLVPHLGRSTVTSSGIFVGHFSHNPDTVAAGNATVAVALRNFGTSQTATGVRAVLRAADNSCAVTDSVRDYGDIAPGGTGSAAGFGLTVAAACTSCQQIPLVLDITSGSDRWEARFTLTTRTPTLRVAGYAVHDANGVLEPGETAEISCLVANRGDAATGLTAVLRSLNPSAVSVLDSSGTFGDIARGDSSQNDADRFQVRASSSIGIGRRFSMRLVLRGAGGTEQPIDFDVTVGQPVPTAPFGPDRYGYFAYDDVDAGYSERPDFSWVEIDPAFGGSGTRLELSNDTSVPVSLPFAFRFYGQDYATVSVCDNGFVGMGSSWLGDAYNWSIPSPMGPDGLIAPFWDDFRTDTAGASGVYTWYDAGNHRFVIEWSRCVHVHGFRPPYLAEPQTFEVLLYDPQYRATPTGDGPILAQYLQVQDDDTLTGNNHNYATVGIGSPWHNDGLECSFAGQCPAAVAPLAAGRAILFTTVAPDTFTAVREGKAANMTGMGRFSCLPSVARRRVTLGLPTGLGPMTVSVFDISGRRRVSRPVAAGTTGLGLNLEDDAGNRLTPGAYYVVLTRAADATRLSSVRLLVLD